MRFIVNQQLATMTEVEEAVQSLTTMTVEL